jgi:CelD/BcsL family acetyltransferase involved in cellulose biosynthesis
MRITLVDPIRDPRWDAFVDSHSEGTIYHHSAWSKVLYESYGFTPQYYALEDGEEFKAIAPFCHVRSRLSGSRLICLPFSDYCFPLAKGPVEMKLLIEAVLRKAAALGLPLEIRGWGSLCRPQEFGLVENTYFVIHRANLDGNQENLLHRIDTRARRGVKAAERQRVSARVTKEAGDLKQFYRLNVETRKKLGVLPQPFRFFEAIHRNLLITGRGFLLAAEAEGEMVAGVLYLVFRDTFTYKFNASSTEYLHLRPNHLLILKGMEMAGEKGYKYFDFGRSEPESEGLREFKSQWATVESALPYYYFPAVTGASALTASSLKRKAMVLFTRSVPEPVLRLAGSVLYRHMA